VIPDEDLLLFSHELLDLGTIDSLQVYSLLFVAREIDSNVLITCFSGTLRKKGAFFTNPLMSVNLNLSVSSSAQKATQGLDLQ